MKIMQIMHGENLNASSVFKMVCFWKVIAQSSLNVSIIKHEKLSFELGTNSMIYGFEKSSSRKWIGISIKAT